PTDRNENWRSQQSQLCIQPRTTVLPFLRRGDPISAAGRVRPRVAAGDRRYVDALASRRLAQSRALEPPEQRTAGAASERTTASSLHLPRCLADEHRIGRAGSRDDRARLGREAVAAAAGRD